MDKNQPGVIGGDSQQAPYPSDQFQEAAVDIDRSFFSGLPLLDDELIRLNLVPPQLRNIPDAESEVDAGTDQ